MVFEKLIYRDESLITMEKVGLSSPLCFYNGLVI